MGMKILNDRQIRQKIRRLAYEILEQNYEEQELILAGINSSGMAFAHLLHEQLSAISSLRITLTRVSLNPADPLSMPVELEQPVSGFANKVVIFTDDVANTGRTIFYAIKPLLEVVPKKVEVAVLVDRTHKLFPVKVDYCGLSLATTFLEHIDVEITQVEEFSVYLN
jgi:pyrimidine operon attenuation protein/uracil phosphoribosyltransferase